MCHFELPVSTLVKHRYGVRNKVKWGLGLTAKGLYSRRESGLEKCHSSQWFQWEALQRGLMSLFRPCRPSKEQEGTENRDWTQNVRPPGFWEDPVL